MTESKLRHPCYFFGCENHTTGHFWKSPGFGHIRDGLAIGAPWKHIDGRYTPSDCAPEGEANLIHDHDWTILAFCDRSVDSRAGSNANFVAPGTHSFEEMCELAKRYFPHIWGRFNYPIVLVSKPSPVLGALESERNQLRAEVKRLRAGLSLLLDAVSDLDEEARNAFPEAAVVAAITAMAKE